MSKIKMGQFVIGNSIIHRLDSRAKIIAGFLIISSAIISSNYVVSAINLLILVLAIKLTDINLLKFFSRLKRLLILFLFTFFFQSVLTQGDVIFHIGIINVTKQGILLGIVTIARLLTIYLCSTILTTTTSPMKLTSGLDSIFSPLNFLNVPVNKLSMIISISLRFIPVVIEETENIKDAQKSRGAQFESRNLFVRLKCMTAVLIPVMAASLQRAADLAAAMESRCYSAEFKAGDTPGIQFEIKDVLAIIAASSGLLLWLILVLIIWKQ